MMRVIRAADDDRHEADVYPMPKWHGVQKGAQ